MWVVEFIKQLIKRKLENGWSISIDLPTGYTVPKGERTNGNQRTSVRSAKNGSHRS